LLQCADPYLPQDYKLSVTVIEGFACSITTYLQNTATGSNQWAAASYGPNKPASVEKSSRNPAELDHLCHFHGLPDAGAMLKRCSSN